MNSQLPDSDSSLDRIAPTRRPETAHIGYQQWRNLAFLHWAVDVELLAPFLPPQLSVDTYQGRGWVGLVPFQMQNVRPRFLPAVPGLSHFPETNVRTYVHFEGRNPGVWFFSLDAGNSLAVRIARWKWRLNYFRADMLVDRQDRRLHYRSSRLWPEPIPAETDIVLERGPATAGSRAAEPGSLEHFLCERYILYTQDRRGRLLRGQVHHAAYPLEDAVVQRCAQTVLPAAGLELSGPPEHVLFSAGVDVRIFPLRNC